MSAPAAVILAAGQGTRMNSALPKVAHEVAGRAMVAHVVRAARAAGADPVVVVIGHGADAVRAALADEDVRFAVQEEQKGTGHALACAQPALAGHAGPIFVLNGDGPLLRAETLRRMAEAHARAPRPGRGMTLLTATLEDPSGLGRIVRGPDGKLVRIVEEKDADEAVRALQEVNPGVYLVDAGVWRHVARLGDDNAAGEVYVTDLPAGYLADGEPVRTLPVADPEEVLAANDRVQLAELERVARARIARRWMRAGVTMLAPQATVLDDDVELARDVVLEPFVVLRAGTRVGEGARIGAGAVLDACEVAPGARVAPNTTARDARFT